HALELWDSAPTSRTGLERVDLLRRAAQTAFDTGEGDRALVLVDAALGEGTEDRLRHAELVMLRARISSDLGRPDDGESLRRVLTELPDGERDETRAAVLWRLAARYLCDARFGDSIAASHEAIEATEDENVALSARLVLGPA